MCVKVQMLWLCVLENKTLSGKICPGTSLSNADSFRLLVQVMKAKAGRGQGVISPQAEDMQVHYGTPSSD